MRILIAEDEPVIRSSLKKALQLQGYEVVAVENGVEALEYLAGNSVEAMVVDIMMPELDGLSLTRNLKKAGDETPILMLTAREAVADRVEGLEAGADDYLVKPFALEELLARLKAILRRGGIKAEETLSYQDISMNLKSHEAKRGERRLELSRTEWSLLELFLTHPNQVLSKSVIFERVWGYDFGDTSNSLEVYIGYLRKKLEAEGEKRLIHTVRGFGYLLK